MWPFFTYIFFSLTNHAFLVVSRITLKSRVVYCKNKNVVCDEALGFWFSFSTDKDVSTILVHNALITTHLFVSPNCLPHLTPSWYDLLTLGSHFSWVYSSYFTLLLVSLAYLNFLSCLEILKHLSFYSDHTLDAFATYRAR